MKDLGNAALLMTRRRFLAIAGIAAATPVFGGCGTDQQNQGTTATSTSGGAPKQGGTLRVGALGKRSAIVRDPHEIQPNESDFLIASLVFEAMTIPGAEPVVPRLMSSWEPNADLTRWRFTIADGAAFHDGTPVTADDVVGSLQRLRQTKAGSSRMPGIDQSGIGKVDERTVELTANAPNADLPLLLRLQTFVFPEGTMDPAGAPGSGPFKLESSRDGNATLVRNDQWHGGRVPLERIEVTMFEDATAMANAAMGGEIDLASNVGPVAARLAEGRGGVTVVKRPDDLTIPIVMRVADGPFSDVQVRQAVRLAVNREALVQGALNGYGHVANDVLGVRDPSYLDDLEPRRRDVGAARRLLAKAGFDTTATYPIYTTPEVPGLVETATLFATQMKELGLRVEVAEQDTGTFYDRTWLKAPLYTTYWGTNDSVSFFVSKTMLSTATQNETGWKDPRVDELYGRAVGDPDASKRAGALVDLQRLQHEESGYVVWGMADGIDLAGPKVRDLPRNAGYGRVFLERAWMDS